jgi:hypothetical protein
MRKCDFLVGQDLHGFRRASAISVTGPKLRLSPEKLVPFHSTASELHPRIELSVCSNGAIDPGKCQ